MKTMTRVPRVLVAVASLLLGVMYFAPVWSIRLIAPQYPEGLGLLIRLNTITGVKEHDLNSINSLNHYIGMRPIEPSAIPELTFMPWIVAALIGVGLLAAVVGRRRLLVAWVAAFAAICVAGMYDFWRWGYDYGHNLDTEQAIIEVPGMSYQPPLIGTKQLLNFRATSLPASGGLAAGAAFALAAAAVLLTWRRGARRTALLGTAVLASACATGAPVLHLGVDACIQCRMLVSDGRFGAAIVTAKGKTLPFDSIDCLMNYMKAGLADQGTVWVVDAGASSRLVLLDNAVLREGGPLRPPMGTLVSYAR